MSADIVITIGRCIMSRNHLGMMKIAKNRRGEEGVEQPYIRLNNGRFIPLPEEVYDNLKMIKEKRLFTEGEINQLIAQNRELRAAAENSLIMDSNVPMGFAAGQQMGGSQFVGINHNIRP